eukprot:3256534-Pyramimonas_sp.AAC.1
MIAGGFNINVDEVQRSMFINKNPRPRHPREDSMHASSRGRRLSHRFCGGQFDVPWAPHCGLAIALRSTGQQLLARTMPTAPRLPQLARPSQQAASDSKSDVAKKVTCRADCSKPWAAS